MNLLSDSALPLVVGGLDVNQCKADVQGAGAIGAVVMGSIGAALGPAGASVGALAGTLIGGAVASRISPACSSVEKYSGSSNDPIQPNYENQMDQMNLSVGMPRSLIHDPFDYFARSWG